MMPKKRRESLWVQSLEVNDQLLLPRGPSKSKSGDCFDASKAVVKDPYADFAPLSTKVFMERFKGISDVSFSKHKSDERWKKEGGMRMGKWIEPVVYTPHNLPHHLGVMESYGAIRVGTTGCTIGMIG